MLGYILSFFLALILIAVSTLSVQLAMLAWVRVSRTAPKVPMAQLSDSDFPHVPGAHCGAARRPSGVQA